MNINGIFIFIATCIIFSSTPYSQLTDAVLIPRVGNGSCTANKNCYQTERCENNKCINTCESVQCGENAGCIANYHEAICTCKYGWIGDPLTKCTKRSCTANNDCYHSEKCENEACVSVCESSSCGHRATCSSKNHSRVCTCDKRHTGDPYGGMGCVREKNCTGNNDCYGFEKCSDNVCINVCESGLCGKNSACTVQNHIGTCSCAFGFVGDPLIECVPRSCAINEDCREDEECESNQCIHACPYGFCGRNAQCDVKDHVATCNCNKYYTGNPLFKCFRLNCTTNDDCYESEKCEGNQCISLCEPNPCGGNAQCDVKDHVATCTCPPGLTGDPLYDCVLKNCTDSNDCPDSQKCQSNKCVDACDGFIVTGMICNAKDHIAVYTCAGKYSGDVYTGCVRSNCTTNNDCYFYEKCESNKCIDA